MPFLFIFATVCLVALSGVFLRRCAARRAAPVAPFDAIACASISDGIIIQTLDGIIIWANPAYLSLFRLSRNRVLGRNPLSFCEPRENGITRDQIAAFRYDPDDPSWTRPIVARNRRGDGNLFWNQISVSFHRTDDGSTLAVLVCRDVTEQVDHENDLRATTQSLAHIAEHDSLTGVANRNRFNAVIADALSGPPEARPGIGVLQIDLDEFKAINDRYGHAAGDAALRHVARTLSPSLRRTDLLARLGGDEFVAVCPGVTQESELLRIGHALGEAVRAPLRFEGRDINVSISIGAALADQRDTSGDTLLRKSDFALYEVKRTGRGRVAIYDSHLHAEAQRRDQLSTQLRDAIEGERLRFYFQPTIDLSTGNVRGFEALARWPHASEGLIHPSVFVPIARALNLMAQIDLAAARAAAALQKQLTHNGFGHVRVGINGSRRLLDDRAQVMAVLAEFTRVGVQPRLVVIELAERDVFGDADRIEANTAAISRLVDFGFSVLIDGFGAGYAGLLHVDKLAVAGFKIEKAFIRHLDSAPACERISRMLLQFARERGIYCVACGIETTAQADLVRAIGGLVGQGNHFARAMPPEDVVDWMRSRQPRLVSAG